jgi:SAM-dependent methyltransferase
VLKKPSEIRSAYSDQQTADDYIDTRFTSAWGAVLHATQIGVVNDVIRQHRVNRVLEIAPGPGRLSADVSGFKHGYLCEFNSSMLNVAKQRLAPASGWRIVQGDAFHLPFTARRFDMIYSFRFVRHFEIAERTALYTQIRDSLADDGLFVFDAVNERWRRGGAEGYPIYDVLYDKETLTRELLDHGFTPVRLVDAMRQMGLQYRVQLLLGPRSAALARAVIRGLEYLPGSPLEWIVVCRRTRP